MSASKDDGYQSLSFEDLEARFGKMGRSRSSAYYRKVMGNPNTPASNIAMLKQYRDRYPDRFLSPEEENAMGSRGSYPSSKGLSGGWRRKDRVGDSGGFFSYDNDGNRYDRYGNHADRGDWHDGGYDEEHPYEKYDYNTSSWSGAFGEFERSMRREGWGPGSKRRRGKPIAQPRSVEEIGATMSRIETDVGRTRYFMKAMSNPDTPAETKASLAKFRNANPGMFVSDEAAAAAGPVRTGRKGFWSSFWKSDEEFAGMPGKEKKFFVKALKSKSHARNTAYGLRVMTNPNTSDEDKHAMANVVNSNPRLFFKGSGSGDGPGGFNGGGRS